VAAALSVVAPAHHAQAAHSSLQAAVRVQLSELFLHGDGRSAVLAAFWRLNQLVGFGLDLEELVGRLHVALVVAVVALLRDRVVGSDVVLARRLILVLRALPILLVLKDRRLEMLRVHVRVQAVGAVLLRDIVCVGVLAARLDHVTRPRPLLRLVDFSHPVVNLPELLHLIITAYGLLGHACHLLHVLNS